VQIPLGHYITVLRCSLPHVAILPVGQSSFDKDTTFIKFQISLRFGD
jgi:hypothetical protein